MRGNQPNEFTNGGFNEFKKQTGNILNHVETFATFDALDNVLSGYGPGCDVPSVGIYLASCSRRITRLYLDVFRKCFEFCGVKPQRECSKTFRGRSVIFERVSQVFSGIWEGSMCSAGHGFERFIGFCWWRRRRFGQAVAQLIPPPLRVQGPHIRIVILETVIGAAVTVGLLFGSLCPPAEEPPRFLQLYIYDTDNEVQKRMHHFGGIDNSQLEPGIVECLIHFLDAHNESVQLFRTTIDKCKELDIPEFKIQLYNVEGARGYELPTSNTLGAMVLKVFPLLFIYGQPGYHTKLTLKSANGVESAGLDKKKNKMIFEVTTYRGCMMQFLEESEMVMKLEEQLSFLCLLQAIKRFMSEYPYLTAFDRADVVCRVFEQKIQALIAFLKEERIFRDVTEASRIRIAEDVDRLPDPRIDPKGYNIVSEMMMHGPCGAFSLKAPCMKGDKCSKKFPKKFNQKTFFDENGHVHYRRRDTSVSATRNEFYMFIKYMFKYISKGTNRLFARVSKPISESSTAATSSRQVIDEIQNYVEAIQILAVYLEDMQRITFRDQDMLKSVIDLPGKKNTTLNEWLSFNEANEQKGCRDFWEVQTVNGVFYPTYRAACQALGLLGDDKEWEIAFEEACRSATPEELWFLFSHILLYYDVADASRLWRKYWKEMSYDILKSVRKRAYIVYGQGGTGKTFLWKTIISSLRFEGKIVLVVTSSRIASLLLPSYCTAHSRFKLPLELMEESLCRITKNTQLRKLLVNTDLIIWDEALMNDRRFEALDRSLRDIVDKPSSLFGRKSVLLGDDFQQTLPVKKGASKIKVISSCISESTLWPSFKVFMLKHNMRLARPDISLEERSLVNSFASWLLDIGDRKIGEPADEDPKNTSWVHIPPAYCLPPDEQGLSKLIDFIYDQSTLHTPSATTLQQKTIVCPKNETAYIINSKVLAMVPGESTIYISQYEATPTRNDGAETEMFYLIEQLNTFKLPSFPPHQLELRVDAPVMLLGM
ncbi:DNA helicase [Tanacetum coccineum]